MARRLCTAAGFYRYAEQEGLIDRSPAVHVRRPRLDYESTPWAGSAADPQITPATQTSYQSRGRAGSVDPERLRCPGTYGYRVDAVERRARSGVSLPRWRREAGSRRHPAGMRSLGAGLSSAGAGQCRRMPGLPERLAQGVAERVVALVVDALDLDALLAKVDVDALLARVDVDALLERVDVDALLARIDMDQLVARIDLASTMAGTASNAAEETLGALRRMTVRGDDVTARWAERLARR